MTISWILSKKLRLLPLRRLIVKLSILRHTMARNLTFLPLSILMTIACVNITNLTYECSTLQQELSLV